MSIELNLDYLSPRLMDKLGWSKEKATQQILNYKRCLWIRQKYPDVSFVPNKDIDQVWHNHILYTQRYAQDCQILFGTFLHHTPTQLTDDPEQNKQILTKSREKFLTIMTLYQMEFGEFPING